MPLSTEIEMREEANGKLKMLLIKCRCNLIESIVSQNYPNMPSGGVMINSETFPYDPSLFKDALQTESSSYKEKSLALQHCTSAIDEFSGLQF